MLDSMLGSYVCDSGIGVCDVWGRCWDRFYDWEQMFVIVSGSGMGYCDIGVRVL